jgi:hypothetical protein
MPATHTFFGDESGSAGINYLDSSQPFHVAAGFLVAQERLAAAEAVVRAEFRQGEVKGKELMGSPAGRRRVVRVLNGMGQSRALPFFIIMERRFSIAGRLVEVFLDPAHQDAVDWLPIGDMAQREAVAERLLELLPGEILDLFARIYRDPDAAGFRAVLQAVIEALRTRSEDHLARSFAGAVDHLDTILEAERYGPNPLEHAQSVSLNVPAFMHLIKRVDMVMDAYRHSVPGAKFQLVHDRQPQFEAAFARGIAGSLPPALVPIEYMISNGRPYRQHLQNFDSYSFADSAAVPMLQAADILASCVRRILFDISSGKGDEVDKELVMLTLPALLERDDEPPPFAGIYASSKTKEALMGVLLDCSGQG